MKVQVHIILQRYHDNGNCFGTPVSYPDYNNPQPVEVPNEDWAAAEAVATGIALLQWAANQPSVSDGRRVIAGLENILRDKRIDDDLEILELEKKPRK